MGRDGDAMTFHVHGSGMLISRIVNEFGISRTMTGAVKDSFGPDDAWTSSPRASKEAFLKAMNLLETELHRPDADG